MIAKVSISFPLIFNDCCLCHNDSIIPHDIVHGYIQQLIVEEHFCCAKKIFYSLFRKHFRQDRAHNEEKQNAEVPNLNFHP